MLELSENVLRVIYRGRPNIAESFFPKNYGDIRHFRQYKEKKFRPEKKRLGVRNDDRLKIRKIELGNLILKYDVIRDALQVIYNKNLKRPRYWLFRRYGH
jgi:hypothetical protein